MRPAGFLNTRKKIAINKNRRKRLENIYDRLIGIYEDLDAILDEEQEAYGNMPESLQESEKGERMQECIECMESAKDDANSAATLIEEVIA